MSLRNEMESENITDKKPRPKRAPIEIYKIGALSKIKSAKANQLIQPDTRLEKCQSGTNFDEFQSVANLGKDQRDVKPNSANHPSAVKPVQQSIAKSSRPRLNYSAEVSTGKLHKYNQKKSDNEKSCLTKNIPLSKETKVSSIPSNIANNNTKETDKIDNDDISFHNTCSTQASKPLNSRSFSSNKMVNKLAKPHLQNLIDLNLQEPINVIDSSMKNVKSNTFSVKSNSCSKDGPNLINDEDFEEDYFLNQPNGNLQFSNSKKKDDKNNHVFLKKPVRSKLQQPVQKPFKYGNENECNSMNNDSPKKYSNYNNDTALSKQYNIDKEREARPIYGNKYNKNASKQTDKKFRTLDRPAAKASSKHISNKISESKNLHLNAGFNIIDNLMPGKSKSCSPLTVSKEDFNIKLNDKKCFKNSDNSIKLKEDNNFELEVNQTDVIQISAVCPNLMKDGSNSNYIRGSSKSVELSKNILIVRSDTGTNNGAGMAEKCLSELAGEQEVTKFNYLKIDDLSDETSSQSQDSENDSKIDNPMVYIKFQENLFCKNSHSKNLVVTPSKRHHSAKATDMNNICWGDEKWPPALGPKKKSSKQKEREVNLPESPGRRGIIQIGNSTTPMLHSYDSSHNNSNIPNVGQKLLFNPNNPSKPVAVTPCARDLPPSWDNSSIGDDKNESDDIVNVEHNLVDASTENGSKIDPSIFYSINKGELDINYYVSSNQIPQEFRRIMDIRKHLQNCYYQLLITDIRYCQDKNIENALWKSLYYVIIEKLREYIAREPTLKERSLSTLLMLVEDGLDYLQKLLKDLQNAYRFSLDNNMDEDLMTVPGTKNRVRLALFSCQKILLCMGDLARYKEHYSHAPNFNSAKTWYEKALQVHPRNGRPFNQLAIIAVSQKRPLDVVYYYIRSLTAANPFTSARDSLISMFDDIRKKYDGMEKLPSHPKFKNESVQQEDLDNGEKKDGLRQEIWIRPDSGATYKRTLTQSDHEEERNALITELMHFPPDQLMKHFLTAFLHCHGMLFSRVGLEYFVDVLADTLNLFHVLMKLSPSRLSPTHLLQIMAVNMFAVDNTQSRGAVTEGGLRSAYQAHALLLAQEMFARLAETMVSLFPKNFNYTPVSNNEGGGKLSAKHNKRDGQSLFMPQLAQYVQAAKVWCDWLLYQSSTWNPPAIGDPKLGLDTWGVIGELATIVKGIGSPDVTLLEDGPNPHVVPVILPEDSFLRGYTPLLAAHRNAQYVQKGTSLERARDWVRICKFQLCLSQFLCGVEPPILRLQKTDQGEILVPIVAETPPDSPSTRPNRDSISNSDVDVDESFSDIDSSDEEADHDKITVEEDETPLALTVKLLACRKKKLEKQHRRQRRLQASLEGYVTLEMEVRPRYLVPDTNCFIEHLDIIKALVKKNAYTLMVPLVVMSELDGLSRDTAVEKYGDAIHAVNVREGSAAALHYIQSTKHSQLKCVTSQGSILSSTMFTSEIDSQPDVTNDDKILSCCLQYCSDTHQRRVIKKGVRRLYREVVLLTEDRNLRVKAYARDVPVRNLLDFAHWAGIK